MKTKKKITMVPPVEVLHFRRGDNAASIATSGSRHVSQEYMVIKEHKSLEKAISYLEAKGYNIDLSGSMGYDGYEIDENGKVIVL